MSIVKSPKTCKPFRIHPERLTLEHARDEEYEILTFGDGFGEVYGPEGQHYTISNFLCNCPDAEKNDGGTYEGYCKHSWWLSQLHICEECGGEAELMETESPITHNKHRFVYVCPICGDVKGVKQVHAIRQRARQEARRAAEMEMAIEKSEEASALVFGD